MKPRKQLGSHDKQTRASLLPLAPSSNMSGTVLARFSRAELEIKRKTYHCWTQQTIFLVYGCRCRDGEIQHWLEARTRCTGACVQCRRHSKVIKPRSIHIAVDNKGFASAGPGELSFLGRQLQRLRLPDEKDIGAGIAWDFGKLLGSDVKGCGFSDCIVLHY